VTAGGQVNRGNEIDLSPKFMYCLVCDWDGTFRAIGMDNFFITEYFDWRFRLVSLLDRLTSRVLSKLLGKTEFRSADFFDNIYTRLTGNAIMPSTSGIMTNIEQRMNMYHLVSQVLAYGVEGDFVELGCNTGHSSVLITKLLQGYNSDKKFYVYDSFEGLPETKPVDGNFYKKGYCESSEDVLKENFMKYICRFIKDGFKIRDQAGSMI